MTDRLEKLMASLIESGKETDRRLQETDRIVQENALQLEKTRQQMAETDKKLKALGIQVGGIDENQGHHAEQYFQNAFE
ncbi:MAG: hypothetical protein LBU89_08310, partial [Fibromonadaceae bacterium]|nr:hypothetical protein [Fibromonadaceae bacterium]